MKPLPNPIRAILYDLDGVLIHSGPAWFSVLRRATRHFGTRDVGPEEFRETFGQGMEADRARFFPRATVAEIEAFYDAAFAQEVGAVQVAGGARELLQWGRTRGIAQAVVTNAPRPVASLILDATGLAGYLQAVAAAGDAPEKPAPDLVHLALSRLRATAAQALYVGDSETDVQAARAAGVFIAGIGVEADVTLGALSELAALLG